MKTINEIIIIVLLVFVMTAGLSQVFTKAGAQGNLNQESLDIVALYDTDFQTLNNSFYSNYTNAKGLTNYNPDANLLGDEFKEYFEHKSRIDQLKDTMNMAYSIPDLLFLSIPFVDYSDTLIYRNVAWLLVFISIFTAIIVAIRKGKMSEEDG